MCYCSCLVLGIKYANRFYQTRKCVNQRAFVGMCEDIYRATSFLHYSQSINNLMYSGTAGELEHYERFLRDPFFHMNVIIIDPDRGLIFGWIWSERRFHFQSFKKKWNCLLENTCYFYRRFTLIPLFLFSVRYKLYLNWCNGLVPTPFTINTKGR